MSVSRLPSASAFALRLANEVCQRLPMPLMWNSAFPNFGGITTRNLKLACDGTARQRSELWLHLFDVELFRQPGRMIGRRPCLHCCVISLPGL